MTQRTKHMWRKPLDGCAPGVKIPQMVSIRADRVIE